MRTRLLPLLRAWYACIDTHSRQVSADHTAEEAECSLCSDQDCWNDQQWLDTFRHVLIANCCLTGNAVDSLHISR